MLPREVGARDLRARGIDVPERARQERHGPGGGASSGSRRTLLVLGWHNVVSSAFFPKRDRLSVRAFDVQVAALSRVMNVLPLDQALGRLTRGEPLPQRAVALTFDDGYADHLDVVAPILVRHRVPATFFLCPGLLDRTVQPWWEVVGWAVNTARTGSVRWRDRRYGLASRQERRGVAGRIAEDLKRLDHEGRVQAVAALVEECRPSGRFDLDGLFLDWVGAQKLVELGFTIGSHTVSHCVMDRESAVRQAEEVNRCREALAGRLGIDPMLFAYPNGQADDFSQVTMDILEASGHEFSVSTIFGCNEQGTPPHAIRRVMVEPQHGPAAFIPMMRAQGRRTTRVPAAGH
ncbi:MAG: polysaccharide deacetylase family protein [Marmoricola sp.]